MKKKPKFKVVNLYNKRIRIPIEMYDEIYKKVLRSMSAELFVFLTKNKVIKRFINYCIADYCDCNQSVPSSLYIIFSNAFDWTATKEGHGFWCNLYHKYTDSLTNNFNIKNIIKMKKSFILHSADDNESELLIATDAFSYATYSNYHESTIVVVDGEEFLVIESVEEIQRLYEETEG